MLYAVLTALTLIAFAANSLLCRMALRADLIDPVSFTTLRLVSGAAMLFPVAWLTRRPQTVLKKEGSWVSGFALFAYAIAFSLAYVSLDVGMGALILFGGVQATMIGIGMRSGEHPRPIQWLGLITAIGGLTYLVFPGISAPNPVGALLMFASGVAWGVYSIRGKGVPAPVQSTASNFMRTVPMTALASLLALSLFQAAGTGIILALISGSLTSGLGYVLWYRALRGLTTTQAAVVQLLVPVLAALGGVVFLTETVSLRLVVSAVLVLGGVALAVLERNVKQR
jgi:drug/metabolite transporter (DMT)-like permease